MDIRRTGSIKKGEDVIGNETKVKVVKNKMAPPFRFAEFDIRFGTGFDRAGEVLGLGVSLGILEKSGAWFSYKGEKIGSGKDNAREFLLANAGLYAEIEKSVRAVAFANARADKAGITKPALATNAGVAVKVIEGADMGTGELLSAADPLARFAA